MTKQEHTFQGSASQKHFLIIYYIVSGCDLFFFWYSSRFRSTLFKPCQSITGFNQPTKGKFFFLVHRFNFRYFFKIWSCDILIFLVFLGKLLSVRVMSYSQSGKRKCLFSFYVWQPDPKLHLSSIRIVHIVLLLLDKFCIFIIQLFCFYIANCGRKSTRR